MNIVGLDHFTIRTPKLVETLLFYQDILGLKLGWRPQFGFPGHWLYASNKPILHLVEAGDQALEAYLGESRNIYGSGRVDHLSFRGKDLQQMQQHLCQQRMIFQERIVPEVGEHQLFLEDPNGIKVEMIFPYAKDNAIIGIVMDRLAISDTKEPEHGGD
ncbi:VOC family protein [Shewanella sp. SP2S2-4]|uniref:VOC family protein n=1 Tax=Shewanella sp. SP2S2-4 TaxID=3063539 RepID=UPI00288D0250|nr:VOC family protein [Shewanella sp. SP2S2-4]MDT3275368.1 VOC family protein [Shewanella sp. SP2S2-4]